MKIEVHIPRTEPVHVGSFEWYESGTHFRAEFFVHVPADTLTPSLRSWRENLLTIQLMMAWEELIERGCKNIKYVSLNPHPIF